MKEHPDVLIIGGGVIGLSAAYFLAGDGLSVEVVERADFGKEASWAGAGILPPGNSQQARTGYDLLRARSSELFPAFSAELREETGIDNGYWRCGGIEFVTDEGALQQWQEEGIDFEPLDEQKLEGLEVVRPPRSRAFFLPGMAQIRNPRHTKALVAACQRRGVRLSPATPVHGFSQRGQRVTAAETADGRLSAERFLVTAGAWTDAILGRLGVRCGIRPVRGQIALLETEMSLLNRILLWGKRYIVPRTDGRVLVGSTEEDVGYDKRTTAAAIGDLLHFAAGLMPALASAQVERCWAGLRPGSPDGVPFIGRATGFDNLFVAAGHFRAGLQLSPATGVVVSQLLTGRPPMVPLDDFRLDRSPGHPHAVAVPS